MNETIQVPFDAKTAKNGDKYIHRSFGEVTYIGKHPTMENCHIVLAPNWQANDGGFKTVLAMALHTEKTIKTLWINVYKRDVAEGYLFYHYDNEQTAVKNQIERHLCTFLVTKPLRLDTVA